ncbi:MAG: lycopene cyclase domain-containing protein [Verrucomicrobiota bacterium]
MLVVFVVWDLYAIASGHWWFDPYRTTGVVLPGDLPLDELLFFVVIPVCAVLSLEAVRAVKRWEVGDEAPGEVVDGVRVDEAAPQAAPTQEAS